jgi:hypothetical protein
VGLQAIGETHSWTIEVGDGEGEMNRAIDGEARTQVSGQERRGPTAYSSFGKEEGQRNRAVPCGH